MARLRSVVVLAAVTGAVTGLLVALFDTIVVDWLGERVAELPLWAVGVLPTIGLALAALSLRWLAPRTPEPTTPETTDAYLKAFHDPERPLTLRALPARMLAAIATLGTGGAMGLEGPSLYLGATLGAAVQSRLGRNRAVRWLQTADRRVLMVAGAAAGVAAIFKAPATGAVFALEVPYVDDFARRMLLPALIASATGYLAFVTVHDTTPIFAVSHFPDLSAVDLLGALVIGVLAGVAARGFARILLIAKRFSSNPHVVVRVLVAGTMLAAVFAVGRGVTGQSVAIGTGYNTLAWATTGDHAIWVLLVVLVLRIIATSATVGGGGTGGLFIPLVVAGALLGRAAGGLFDGIDTQLCVVIGVAAFLGAGYRVPLAAVVFVAETTGRAGFIVPGLIAAVAAELVMGRTSVTAYQQRLASDT
jgi:chloride channel protein, CIC family